MVTLDIEMPDLNGLETLGYIMSEAPRPVVIVSAHTDAIAQSAIKAFDFGALEIVPKPYGDERREARFRQIGRESFQAPAATEWSPGLEMNVLQPPLPELAFGPFARPPNLGRASQPWSMYIG